MKINIRQNNCSMFYGASSIIFERAKELRKGLTEAERKLWTILRNKKLLGFRFKQQHPINFFIADFYCHALKLVIEVDGEVHNLNERKEYDANRSEEMKNYGIKVLRISNNEVMENIEHVKEKIEEYCKQIIDSSEISGVK